MKPIFYKETKQINGRERRTIIVSLADPCNNGFCTFRVECRTEKLVFGYWQRAYCPNEIQAYRKTFPHLKTFFELNGRNSKGQPSYCVENSVYYLKTEGVEKAAEYMHLSPELVAKLSKEKEYFKYQLFTLGIMDKWAEDAAEGIAKLEELSGETFEDYETPNPYHVITLSDDERAAIEEKIESGYYTEQAQEDRARLAEEQKRAEKRAKIAAYYADKIAEYTAESEIMLTLFDKFGTTENVIYYRHSNTLCFNWTEPQFAHYTKHWSEEEFAQFNRECEGLITKYGLQTEFKYQY